MKNNRCPSPSSSSFISSVSHSRTEAGTTKTSTRDGSSWPVDSSWEWQSDEDENDSDRGRVIEF